MESFILSFEAVTPIFLLMLLGYFLKKTKIADKKMFDGINRLVFKVFLPMLLFYNIYKTQIFQEFDVRLIAFTLTTVLCVFVLGMASVFFITKDNSKRGVILQGFFRSNYAILGIPFINYVCGEEAGGISSLMVAFVVPFFNVLAVIALETFNGGKIDFKKIFKGVLTNPLIIGCICGIAFKLLGIKLPKVIEVSIADASKIASPLAILVLGATFSFSGIRGYFKENVIVAVTRLIIVPFIALFAALNLGFTGEAFACLIIVFGSPVAVSSFAMAQQMGGDENLAGQLVVVTSALCVLTLFMWVYIFSSIGVI